jgi:hypothetical protein
MKRTATAPGKCYNRVTLSSLSHLARGWPLRSSTSLPRPAARHVDGPLPHGLRPYR